MLQSIRDNAQGLVAKLIIGFIAFTFAIFGLESLGGFGNSQQVASVNGVEISPQELARAVDMQRRALIGQMGDQFDPSQLDEQQLQQQVLQQMIARMILLQSAEDQALAYSDQALDQEIVANERFHEDGRFSPDLFTRWVRSMGMSPVEFRQLMREDRMLTQIQAGLVATEFMTAAEVQQLVALQEQTRDLRYVRLSLADEMAKVVVADDEVKAYYDTHAAQYKSEEQVSIEYVELHKEALEARIEVSEEEIKEAYERYRAEQQEQAATRKQVAHILIKGLDEAAKAKAESLYAQLQQGADFAALAREHSDDRSSAANGGDLGAFEPGFLGDAFDAAVARLGDGERAEPFATDFGYELVQVSQTQAPVAIEPLELIRSTLEARVRAQKLDPLFVETSRELADLSYEAADLAEPAAALGLEVQSTPLFTRQGLEEGPASTPRVVAAAFAEDVLEQGNNSDLIALDENHLLVLRVKEHKAAQQLPLDAVVADVQATLKAKAAGAALQQQADQLLAELKQGQSLTLDWQQASEVGRRQQTLPQQLVVEAFKMPHPENGQSQYSSVELADGDIALLALDQVNAHDRTLTEVEAKALAQMLAMQVGQLQFQQYRQGLEQAAEIDIAR